MRDATIVELPNLLNVIFVVDEDAGGTLWGRQPKMVITQSEKLQKPTGVVTPARGQWYKDAIIYELHVRSFFDSNGDGIGDFPGLTQKLDYLCDLGVTALWLLPFYESPLKDDGYDIANYVSINPSYGTLEDFDQFIAEAHKRGLRVITELVINHTSDQHAWFQRSRRGAPDSKWRNFYVWTNDIEKYKEARIIFKDYEPSNWTWDPLAKAFYWHRFYSHQPDLNFDNPEVHEEIFKAVDFWFEKGVDGFRLDAIPYLYEREGTSCESLPETHAFLKKLRHYVDEKYGDRMLLAEANQWPDESVTYFGSGQGDECHMAFHFPLMPRLFMAAQMEDRIPVIDIMEQTPPLPETSQWALFLRNHDELTLEMVTDEERDYMWRVYATQPKAKINLGIRHRLAPLLGNNRNKIELLNLLLFSLPGTPVVYYGDEIGMGDNVYLGDRNGVRTPMHWNSDKNAGFSRANPQALPLPIILDPEYHYEANNVEAQQRNPNSMLWWMKRLVALRKQVKAFGQGSIEFLHPENRKILAYIRALGDETILVVANLSRFPQAVQLDLSRFEGYIPTELFGRTKFSAITTSPYILTLSGHSAFWFRLQSKTQGEIVRDPDSKLLRVRNDWQEIFEPRNTQHLEDALFSYVKTRHWYLSRNRTAHGVHLQQVVPVQMDSQFVCFCFLRVEFTEGEPETYIVGTGCATGEAAERLKNGSPEWIIATIARENASENATLYDAIGNETFGRSLLKMLSAVKTVGNGTGKITLWTANPLPSLDETTTPVITRPKDRKDHNNSGMIFADHFFLKIFRRIDAGTNPDLEIMQYLASKQFPNVPILTGSLQYRRNDGQDMTLGILTRMIPDAQSAWNYTIEELGRYFEDVQVRPPATRPQSEELPLLEMAEKEPPQEIADEIGVYLQSAQILGTRTAQLHLALTSDPEDKEFAPEPFTPFYQRSLYQSTRNLVLQTLQTLQRRQQELPPSTQELAEKVIESKERILKHLQRIYTKRIDAMRIRGHGDFHLGQVLYTGKDFYIIDFEGEPSRPLSERKIKRTPMRDVAGMIRSFDYAAEAALRRQLEQGCINQDQLEALRPWRRLWRNWISATYLKAYFEKLGNSPLLPESKEGRAVLLSTSLLEKAIYELGHELNHRPTWVEIPMRGILDILNVWRTD